MFVKILCSKKLKCALFVFSYYAFIYLLFLFFSLWFFTLLIIFYKACFFHFNSHNEFVILDQIQSYQILRFVLIFDDSRFMYSEVHHLSLFHILLIMSDSGWRNLVIKLNFVVFFQIETPMSGILPRKDKLTTMPKLQSNFLKIVYYVNAFCDFRFTLLIFSAMY